MNPRRAWDFLKSRFGLFLLFVVAVFGGSWFFGRHQVRERQAARLAVQGRKHVELGQVAEPLGSGMEDGVPKKSDRADKSESSFVPFNPLPTAAASRPAASQPSAPAKAKPPDKPKKIRYPTLLASYDPPPPPAPAAPPPPKRFMPFGTLLKCKLVNTVDSSDAETPIIALLLEDVWQNGELVVPANTLVHGTGRAGRIRDRINASGTWRFVWQDGRELAFSGIALNREYDHDVNGYGITDGSAGLEGRVLTADDFQEMKMLAAAAMSGFAEGAQDRIVSGYGVTIPGSVTNGLWQGAGQVFQTYAQRTLKDIEENGYFVRVAAGKEFYVYVLAAVDPDKAKVAGASGPPISTAVVAPGLLKTQPKG